MANISDLSSLSWQQLVARIRELFSSEDIDIDEVKEVMAAYHTDQKDWSTIATFDAHRYVVMVQRAAGLWFCCRMLQVHKEPC